MMTSAHTSFYTPDLDTVRHHWRRMASKPARGTFRGVIIEHPLNSSVSASGLALSACRARWGISDRSTPILQSNRTAISCSDPRYRSVAEWTSARVKI
jgi:hypothetical protein